jgi:3-methyladenine DNA glycosylase AlkD
MVRVGLTTDAAEESMTVKDVLGELKAMGTAQNRKVYARHGIGPKMYGVSYANLGKLKKRIKTDHALAEQLWASANHDARVLATMIADPMQMSSTTLEQWVKELDNYAVSEAFSSLASRAPAATVKMRKWMRSRHEWIGSAGWNLVTHAALRDDSMPNTFFEGCLEDIQAKIHKSKNRVRYSMNGALISIGMRNPALEEKALAAARRIGTVDVDYGETGCTTPDAATYIAKTRARHSARKPGARRPMRSGARPR